MSETGKSPIVKKNFDFVDTIRCISMIGIVYEHCTMVGEAHYASFFSGMMQASVMQFFKFSTIAFFLIAGFLINHKFTEYTPLQYIKNRFKSTIGPWSFWLNVLVLLDVVNLVVKYFIYHGTHPMPDNFFAYLAGLYYDIIFFSSFWFILNFLICISILLIFKRYIYNIYFGAVLGLISIFYSVNLYYGWVLTSHSTALFGFVFYLWLGAFINKNYDVISLFIKKTSIWWFIGITVFFFILGDLETVYLKEIAIEDAYNTLRISNILYSLSFFVVLLKIGPIASVNKYLEPRQTTFGIYLLHQIIITHLLTEIFRPFRLYVESLTLFEATLYGIIRFLITYSISLIFVILIRKTWFKWSIGNS